MKTGRNTNEKLVHLLGDIPDIALTPYILSEMTTSR